jgi:hypothetical protein
MDIIKILGKKDTIWTEIGKELGENVQTRKVLLLLLPTMNTFSLLLNVDDIVRKALKISRNLVRFISLQCEVSSGFRSGFRVGVRILKIGYGS